MIIKNSNDIKYIQILERKIEILSYYIIIFLREIEKFSSINVAVIIQ